MFKNFILLPFLVEHALSWNQGSRIGSYFKDRLWFYKESNSPFTGTAFEISKETGTIIQQVNYIDGLAWGKYYEWWPNGSKKVNGT